MPAENSKLVLLDVGALTTGYGRAQVLWGIDLKVHERESIVLLGANGAGKTTLLKAIIGLISPWGGHIHFAGEDITRLRTDQRVRRGVVYMSESSGFPGLTVEENILIGAQFLSGTWRADAPKNSTRYSRSGRAPPYAREQLVRGAAHGIAKALAGNPRLLVMDEPSAGLSPLIVREESVCLRSSAARIRTFHCRAERQVSGGR